MADDNDEAVATSTTTESNGAPQTTRRATKKVVKSAKTTKKKAADGSSKAPKTAKKKTSSDTAVNATKKRVLRPYPRYTLQEAMKIPLAVRHKNAGHAWEPDMVREAVSFPKGNDWFYLTAASRDYGLTEGTRDTAEISLTPLGRQLAYAETPEQEAAARKSAFLSVPLFKEVLDYYKGSQLPEIKYLGNTLENKFRLDPEVHVEFADLFRKNCEFLGITEGESTGTKLDDFAGSQGKPAAISVSSDFITVAEPEKDTGLLCFVAMPFVEKTDQYSKGFFMEVLKQIIAPAGRLAGFRVVTARKQGSDLIHATIINGLLDADLVIADLTEHNPNVLFELGVRMAEDKPVALIRATGTKPIFDVDQMLRVEEYNPCLWPSTVEVDMPKIRDHIIGTWENHDAKQTYMKILRNKASQDGRQTVQSAN